MRLLLDTCTFLWITLDDTLLSAVARSMFRDPANAVFLSPVSVWEICAKHSLGRLPLPGAPQQWVPAQRNLHKIETLPFDEAAAVEEPRLVRIHKDPFDRILICQALVHDLTILTPDPLVRQYSVKTAW